MKRSKLKPDFFQRGGRAFDNRSQYTPVQLTDAAFIPTYAGNSLAESEKYGTGMAEMYHKNIADMTRLDMLNASRKVHENDREESAKYDAYLKSQMEDMASKGDYENMTLRTNALAREYVNDKKLKLLAENKEAIDKEREYMEKLRLSGHSVVLAPEIDKFQSITYDEEGNPVMNTFKGSAEQKQDWEGKARDIWSVVPADGGPMSEAEVAKRLPELEGYFTTGQWEGISEDKITKRLKHALNAYKETGEYDQQMRVALNDLKAQGITGPEAATLAEGKVAEFLFSEGMLKTFGKSKADFTRDWVMEQDMKKAKKQGLPRPDVLTGVDISANFTSIDDNLGALFKADDKGAKAYIGSITTGLAPGAAYDPAKDPRSVLNSKDAPWNKGTPEDTANYERIATQILQDMSPDKDVFANFKNTDKTTAENALAKKQFLYSTEVLEKVKEVSKTLKETMMFPAISTLDSGDINKITNEVVSSLTNRKVFADGKPFNPENNKEFFNTLADPETHLKIFSETAGLNSLGTLGSDPAFYNSWVASYIDPKTKEAKQVYIAKNQGELLASMVKPEGSTYVPPQVAADWTKVLQNPYKPQDITLGNTKTKVESRVDKDKNIIYSITEVNGTPVKTVRSLKSFNAVMQAISEIEAQNQ